MCGIIGYTGSKPCVPILMDGLHRLEYRGYDSAGLAVQENGKLRVIKDAGKIAVLEALVQKSPPSGTTGIAHTRWATHGEPNQVNAHPHVDHDGHFAVVHNGIIENCDSLREKLRAKGYKFVTDTDT